jgi:hypothetical protein
VLRKSYSLVSLQEQDQRRKIVYATFATSGTIERQESVERQVPDKGCWGYRCSPEKPSLPQGRLERSSSAAYKGNSQTSSWDLD